MKLYSIFFAVIFFTVSSCQNAETSHNNETPETTENSDATAPAPAAATTLTEDQKIEAIGAYALEVDKQVNIKNIRKENPKWYSPKDVVAAFTVDGKTLRLTTGLYPPNAETRTYFYLRDNELVFVKHREWVKNATPPFARETSTYLDAGRVLKVMERYLELSTEQGPGPLLSLPLQESPLKRDSLLEAINVEFDKVRAVFEGK